MVNDFENFLSNLHDEECLDVVDTPEEGVVQCKKCEDLKKMIKQGKTHFFPREKGKWSAKDVDKQINENTNKMHNLYMQCDMQLKGKKPYL